MIPIVISTADLTSVMAFKSSENHCILDTVETIETGSIEIGTVMSAVVITLEITQVKIRIRVNTFF